MDKYPFFPDPEAMEDTVAYIEREWPDISDAWNCARFVLRNEHMKDLDRLCGFWARHEHD